MGEAQQPDACFTRATEPQVDTRGENREVSQEARKEFNQIEQLMQVNQQLKFELMKMKEYIHSLNIEATYQRMDFIFRVLDHQEVFPDEFVNKCSKEIQEALFKVEEDLVETDK